MQRDISEDTIEEWVQSLYLDEKSQNTIEKYRRDAEKFMEFACGKTIVKDLVLEYKEHLVENYASRSVNSMLISVNRLFEHLGWHDLKVKTMRIQKQTYCSEEKELSKEEYERLVLTARRQGKKRLELILQTLGGTGIRISELPYITVESVRTGTAVVSLKGKTRSVFIIRKLQALLLNYARKQGIEEGPVFVTRSGKPVCRVNVWREMKALCREADVDPRKVFPHNFRHLFARIFYRLHKDMTKLADILGHTNIETTRIYIISTGREHRRFLEKMNLVI